MLTESWARLWIVLRISETIECLASAELRFSRVARRVFESVQISTGLGSCSSLMYSSAQRSALASAEKIE
jgi:hypothetical protein